MSNYDVVEMHEISSKYGKLFPVMMQDLKDKYLAYDLSERFSEGKLRLHRSRHV